MTPQERIRVLVVDDHQMFVQGIDRVLGEEPDMEIVGSAGTVEEALDGVRRHRPAVVLMDYQLPDGDGAHATASIKAVAPETKVVMLTASTQESVLLAAIEAGCSGFVTKHRAVEEVAHAVRAAHAGEAVVSPAMLARLLPKLRRTWRGLGSDLTPREVEVLNLVAGGLTNASIAGRLSVSTHTVRNHVQSIITKLQVHSKLEAVSVAVREGVIRFP